MSILLTILGVLLISGVLAVLVLRGSLVGYPFWVDAAGACSIMHPLTKVTITTVPFEGDSAKQRLVGISTAGGTPTFLNNIRILVGNLPSNHYKEICPNAYDSDSVVAGASGVPNFVDLGGEEIYEGDTITLTAVGTGAFSGVLWIDDLEEADPGIPDGNFMMLKCGGSNDAANAVSVTGGDLDARKLENTRKYTLFRSEVYVEDQILEMVILQCGKRTLALPQGKMLFDRARFEFTGLEWNNGQVLIYVQVAAATKVDIRLFLIESQVKGTTESKNAPPIVGITSYVPPGITGIAHIIGAGKTIAVNPKTTMAVKPQILLK